MNRLVRPFTVLVERLYPNPLMFAIALSGIIFLACLGLTDASPKDTVLAWGDGLAGLMAFIGQLSLTLIASHALAHTDAVRRLLSVSGLGPSASRWPKASSRSSPAPQASARGRWGWWSAPSSLDNLYNYRTDRST